MVMPNGVGFDFKKTDEQSRFPRNIRSVCRCAFVSGPCTEMQSMLYGLMHKISFFPTRDFCYLFCWTPNAVNKNMRSSGHQFPPAIPCMFVKDWVRLWNLWDRKEEGAHFIEPLGESAETKCKTKHNFIVAGKPTLF